MIAQRGAQIFWSGILREATRIDLGKRISRATCATKFIRSKSRFDEIRLDGVIPAKNAALCLHQSEFVGLVHTERRKTASKNQGAEIG